MEQCGGKVWWKSVVKKCGGKVWWKSSVVEQCGGKVSNCQNVKLSQCQIVEFSTLILDINSRH